MAFRLYTLKGDFMKFLILGLIVSGSVFANGLTKENCVTTKMDPTVDKEKVTTTVTTIVCKTKAFTKADLEKLKAEEEAKAAKNKAPLPTPSTMAPTSKYK